MLFNSSLFILVFLPAVLAVYYALSERRTARKVALVIASLIFYGYWDLRFVPLLAGLAAFNWAIAAIFRRSGREAWLIFGIAANLATLGFFKYTNFLLTSIAAVAGFVPPTLDIVLPLGISFLTFKMIGYLADLWKGQRDFYGPLDFSLYVMLFPELIAGPLVRHHEIVPQFEASPRRPEMWENLSRGAVLFLLGLAEKVAIADSVAPNVDRLFAKAAAGDALNLAEGWAAASSFAVQIFFDFAGYSTMAIGLALMLGFVLPLNFDRPYRAVSIRDFWRRWHMTLSRFLRDYLYIPLGGNRKGPARQALAVAVTMLLGGLWHGAAWTFVAWGALHGAGLAIAAAWSRMALPMPRALGWLLTLLFVTACWVLFRAPDFTTAASIFKSMAGINGFGGVAIDNQWVLFVGIGIALLAPPSHRIAGALLPPQRWRAVAMGAVGVWLVLLASGRFGRDFIYFQF